MCHSLARDMGGVLRTVEVKLVAVISPKKMLKVQATRWNCEIRNAQVR